MYKGVCLIDNAAFSYLVNYGGDTTDTCKWFSLTFFLVGFISV
jgi:hypothetical protein